MSHVLPAVSIIPPGEHAWNVPNVVVLPAATLILAVTPYISRIMRGSMVEVLESEYVTMARLKGLSNRTVIWRHAVPNAIVPAIQVSALQLAYMAGGRRARRVRVHLSRASARRSSTPSATATSRSCRRW